jgi:hypothetical protein
MAINDNLTTHSPTDIDRREFGLDSVELDLLFPTINTASNENHAAIIAPDRKRRSSMPDGNRVTKKAVSICDMTVFTP